MTQNSDTQPPHISLHCCNGALAPLPVVDGWKRFLSFPQEAKSHFWTLLGPALMDPASPSNSELIESFCRDHGLPEQDVVVAVQGCDFMLRQASALDLSFEMFQQDLAELSKGESEDARIILSQYNATKAELRKGIIQESLADHGNLLVGLDWRVDKVISSDRGIQLNTDVVMLTFRYRDGDQLERITFQLTHEAIREIKLFCDRFGK